MEEDEGVVEERERDEYGEPVEGEDNSFYKKRQPMSSSVMMRQKRQKQPERDQLIPYQQPKIDPNTMSVGYQVTDTVAYYSNVGLWALFYGRGTRGIISPILYDSGRGAL
jgi:hypothetical protein